MPSPAEIEALRAEVRHRGREGDDDGRDAMSLGATPLPSTHAVSGMVAPVAIK